MKVSEILKKRREQPKEEETIQKYSYFDLLVSRRFHKLLNQNLRFHKNPLWDSSWAEEVRKLREIDGWSKKEIRKTLDFICKDVSPGFCLAKNIRSLRGIRKNWSNGMDAFSNANFRMKEFSGELFVSKKEERKQREEQDFEELIRDQMLEVPKEIRSKAKEFFEFLHSMKSTFLREKNSKKYDLICSKITKLICEFVTERKWPSSLFVSVLDFLRQKKFRGLNIVLLKESVLEFFEFQKKFGWVSTGFFFQSVNGKRVFDSDQTYVERVKEFLGEIENET